jgi:LPXTG-motif cell wall-anchored protein
MIPLFLEAVLLALLGFSAGMLLAYLVVLRRRRRTFWEE